MKKRIAILSLIALFVAATSISAQTTAPKPAEKAKTEKKACCKDPKSADCKKDAKACPKDKKAGEKACDKKADTKK